MLDTKLAPLVSFASGAMAGAAATAASYPFDLLRTTLAAQGEPKVGPLGNWPGCSAGFKGLGSDHGNTPSQPAGQCRQEKLRIEVR